MYVGAHCATDVTGFGILGHARSLAKAQKRSVSFKLHSLPSMSHDAPFRLQREGSCGYFDIWSKSCLIAMSLIQCYYTQT